MAGRSKTHSRTGVRGIVCCLSQSAGTNAAVQFSIWCRLVDLYCSNHHHSALHAPSFKLQLRSVPLPGLRPPPRGLGAPWTRSSCAHGPRSCCNIGPYTAYHASRLINNNHRHHMSGSTFRTSRMWSMCRWRCFRPFVTVILW